MLAKASAAEVSRCNQLRGGVYGDNLLCRSPTGAPALACGDEPHLRRRPDVLVVQTLDALLASPGASAPLRLALVMGGLRPYTTDPLTPGRADEIAGHWEHVHETTGLPFKSGPGSAMHRPGFVYDTEPASRATVVVRTHWPQHVWRYFKAAQRAFYAEGLDIAQPAELAAIAQETGLPRGNFEAAFDAEDMRLAARNDFSQVQHWGIRGFPALLGEVGGELHLVCHGYVPIDELRERLGALPAT
jgi:putative protein-disulfide isomerase